MESKWCFHFMICFEFSFGVATISVKCFRNSTPLSKIICLNIFFFFLKTVAMDKFMSISTFILPNTFFSFVLDSSHFDMTQDTYFTCHIHHLEFRISLVYFCSFCKLGRTHFFSCVASAERKKKLMLKRGSRNNFCVHKFIV